MTFSRTIIETEAKRRGHREVDFLREALAISTGDDTERTFTPENYFSLIRKYPADPVASLLVDQSLGVPRCRECG
jgi:hypothetical protein